MGKNKMIFNIGNKVVKFTVRDFDKNVNIDKLLKIDYGNLVAELVTFPVVVNRLGLLAADMDNEVNLAKLNLSMTEAKLQAKIRIKLAAANEKGKKPTISEVEDALTMNKVWLAKKKEYINIIRDKEYMYSIFNAAKDKSRKLDKLSLTIKTGDVDMELIQKQLNNVYFKIKQGYIED